jgi:hypothetical protein
MVAFECRVSRPPLAHKSLNTRGQRLPCGVRWKLVCKKNDGKSKAKVSFGHFRGRLTAVFLSGR